MNGLHETQEQLIAEAPFSGTGNGLATDIEGKDGETNEMSRKAVFAVAGFCLVLVLARVGRAQSTAVQSAPKMAEEVFQNIEVLKGMPAGQMGSTMEFFRISLGTGCVLCHITEQYPLEDKPDKQLSRKMVEMTLAINKNMYGGRPVVTCYTCHRGSVKPVGMFPVIPETKPAQSEAAEAGGTYLGAMATVDQVLDKYLASIGGEGAIQNISSRVEKATITDISSRKFPVEIFVKAPAKRLAVMHLPKGGDSFTLYNGDLGWTRSPGEAAEGGPSLGRNMRKEDLDQATLEDPLSFAGRMKQVFSDLRVERTEKVEGREAYVTFGRKNGSDAAVALVALYFDKESGLLVRVVYYGESLFGRAPLYQIDYADYRNAGGVKMPFRWIVNKPRPGQEQRFTYQLDEVRQNILIEDSRFVVPANIDCHPPRCSGPHQD